ncbi:MAG: transcriptional repressor [Candidatus Nanopelagicales bacterium]
MSSSSSTSTNGEPRRRVTKQRVAITEVLEGLDAFRSVQEIHDLMLHRGDDVSLTTVYRTLQAMHNDGVVDTVPGDDGEALYRACSDDHHHHLVCRECGLTIEISANQVETWTQNIATEHGFTQPEHMIEISGLCKNCS